MEIIVIIFTIIGSIFTVNVEYDENGKIMNQYQQDEKRIKEYKEGKNGK